MKKTLFFPVALTGLFLGILAFNSCQKEIKSTSTTAKKSKGSSAQVTTKTCNRPIFQDKVLDAACEEGLSCGVIVVPVKNKNRINWRTATQCNLSQDYSGTSYYTLYKNAGAVPGNPSYTLYNQVSTFNCTHANMFYAHTVLTNSSTFVLIVSDASYTLPSSIHEQNSSGDLYNTSGTLLNVSNYYSDEWKFTTGTAAGTVTCIDKGPK